MGKLLKDGKKAKKTDNGIPMGVAVSNNSQVLFVYTQFCLVLPFRYVG